MSQSTTISVLLRDEQRSLQSVEFDEWDATTMLAAVSSDPRSFRELGLAWLRYREETPLESLPWRPDDGNSLSGEWLLIDLACLRLVTNQAKIIPAERGAFQPDEGECTPDMAVVWWNMPPWWQRSVTSDVATSTLADVLTPVPKPTEPSDFRGVLYGRVMAADLAQRMVNIVGAEDVPQDFVDGSDLPWDLPAEDPRRQVASRWRELTLQVHADWLLAPRDDLDGQPPRNFLHRGRDWAEWEVEHRQRQWSRLKSSPRALDRDTHAYRHGPMARDEVVIYFDLCREVIRAGWKLIYDGQRDRVRLGTALYDHARNWLERGSIEGDPTPPAEIIESSRRHLPRLADGTHLDCDCPLCRMMMDDAEMFYPTFTGFDGHHLEMDDEFAFSLHETREEWEAEQEEFRQFNEEFKQNERAPVERLGTGSADNTDDDNADAPDSDADEDEFASAWKSSFVSSDALQAGVSVMTLGFRMTELVSDLKLRKAAQDQIDALNEAFDALRAAAWDTQLRAFAVEQMTDELERLAGSHPDLTSKAADLESQLDSWSRQAVG